MRSSEGCHDKRYIVTRITKDVRIIIGRCEDERLRNLCEDQDKGVSSDQVRRLEW